jgi:hypothetical protein
VTECTAKEACYGTVVYSYTDQCRAHWKLDKGVGKGLNFYKFMQVREEREILYILESNPHPFCSFRGLKNQMRIRIAVESGILEKRYSRCTCRKNNK